MAMSTRDESVRLQVAAPRAIAAVRARLPLSRVSAVFADYLNQVYAASRSGAIQVDGQNIFVYRPADTAAEVDVEFGVGAKAPFAALGAVEYRQLPVGAVATATHWGDYARLGDAHGAIIAWCQANGRKRTGTRWEVYGHWSDDPAKVRTDVYYLLEPSALDRGQSRGSE